MPPLDHRLTTVIWLHRYLMAFAVAYFAAAQLAVFQANATTGIPWKLLQVVGAVVAWMIGIRLAYVVFILRPKCVRAYLAIDLQRVVNLERLAAALIAFLAVLLHAVAFGVFKRSVLTFTEQRWDTTFATWDETLHFGWHPWQILQPAMNPALTSLLDQFYVWWFVVLAGGLVWHIFTPHHSRIRMQFLLAFCCTWLLLGNVLATYWASMGPCYYEHAAQGPNHYVGLMSYLKSVGALEAQSTQELLLEAHVNRGTSFGSGISAMPSMHVSAMFLLTLSFWKNHRLIGWAFAVYTAIIMIGSVHLAWHYAVDGYVSILGTWLIWHAVGWCVRRDPLLEYDLIARTKQTQG